MSEEVLNYIKKSVDRIEDNQIDHAKRIGELERWQSNSDGKQTMLGMVGVCAGAVIAGIVEWVRK